MKKLFVTLFLSLFLIGNSFSDENRYKDYKPKLSAASTDQKFAILKEISFALEFEDDVISSCVGYIKMWKETKGEMCEKAFQRFQGIINLMDLLASNEYKSSIMETSKKIDKFKFDKLIKETERNSSSLSDNIAKLTFLMKNL